MGYNDAGIRWKTGTRGGGADARSGTPQQPRPAERPQLVDATVVRAADALLCDPLLLSRAVEATGRLGADADERARALLYLGLTSRLLLRPLSLAVRGAGSRRRDSLVQSVLALMPPSAYLELDLLAPDALLSTELDLRHRQVVVHAVTGRPSACVLLSRLARSGSACALERRWSGGACFSRESVIQGPIGLVVTEPRLSEALVRERAVWPLDLDERAEETDRMLGAITQRATGGQAGVDVAAWRFAQQRLRRYPVVVPFCPALRSALSLSAMPLGAGKLEDDFDRLVLLIGASALLHQRQREIEGQRLQASLADYRLVHGLVDDLFALSAQELSPQTAALARAVRELYGRKAAPAAAAEGHAYVDAGQIAQYLGWARRTVVKWLPRAELEGQVVCERGRGRSATRIRPGARHADGGVLPTPAALAEAMEGRSARASQGGRPPPFEEPSHR